MEREEAKYSPNQFPHIFVNRSFIAHVLTLEGLLKINTNQIQGISGVVDIFERKQIT